MTTLERFKYRLSRSTTRWDHTTGLPQTNRSTFPAVSVKKSYNIAQADAVAKTGKVSVGMPADMFMYTGRAWLCHKHLNIGLATSIQTGSYCEESHTKTSLIIENGEGNIDYVQNRVRTYYNNFILTSNIYSSVGLNMYALQGIYIYRPIYRSKEYVRERWHRHCRL